MKKKRISQARTSNDREPAPQKKGPTQVNVNRIVPAPQTLRYGEEDWSRAEQEKAGFVAQLNLERQSNAHKRDEQLRALIAQGVRWIMGSIFAVSVAAIFVFAWHYLAPESWHWLPEKQLTALRTFLFSSAVAGVVSSYFQRYG